MANEAVTKMNKKQRSVGLDVLRCIAMMMVVGLHYLGKGELLPDMMKPESWNATGIIAWALEAICIVAVNVYMLISGYLLCKSHFKLSRLISLYIQLWTYSVGVGMLAYLTGLAPKEELTTYKLLTLVLPVSMGHYWFMTAYVYFYLLLPLLGLAVKKMTQKQHKITVILLLLVFCVLKSVLPFKLEMDEEGYSFIWYAIMFLVASYIRLYRPKLINRSSSAVLMIVGMIGSFAEILAIGKIGMLTGKLEYVSTVSMHYNHIFPFLGALGLFGMFIPQSDKLKDDAPAVNDETFTVNDEANGVGGNATAKKPNFLCRIVVAIAPLTLGVYLLHENTAVRYVWEKWFGCSEISNAAELIGYTLLAMLVVFAAGIVVELVRSKLFGLIHAGLKHIKPYRLLTEKIEDIDKVFAAK